MREILFAHTCEAGLGKVANSAYLQLTWMVQGGSPKQIFTTSNLQITEMHRSASWQTTKAVSLYGICQTLKKMV